MPITKPKLNTRKRVQLHFEKPSMTEQTHKDSCDLNKIIKKFEETGQYTGKIYQNGQYETAPIIDLKEALDLVNESRREFSELSPQNQAIFGNNSDNYAQFLTNYQETPESFYNEPEPITEPLVKESTKEGEKGA